MLTIPKAKLNAASELVKENANPFHVDKNKIKNLAPAAKAKLESFLVNFNTFVIYFDPTLDLSKVPFIIKGIKELKGSIAPFMKKGITHYPLTTSNKNSDKLSTAKKLGLVIWNFTKLEKIIAICLELKNEPKPLKEILRDEKIFGPSTSRDRGKKSGCKVAFKGNFILIEENSGKYKPVAVKEFEKESWPTLRFDNSVGKCAFIKETKKSGSEDDKYVVNEAQLVDEFEYYRKRLSGMLQDKSINVPAIEGDEKYLNLDSAPLKEMQEYTHYVEAKLYLYEKLKQNPTTVFQNSAASGLVSGSVAAQALKRDMSKDSRVAYLGTRVVSLVKESKSKNEVIERSVPGKAFYNRPGYCENCNVEYKRFYEHVRSRQHKHWARHIANFNDLDHMFSQMQRSQLRGYPFSDNSSCSSHVDIEALNPDIYDSAEEYPFQCDDISIKDKKCFTSEIVEESEAQSEQSTSEDGCIAQSYTKRKQTEKDEDFIRTQGNQTEPLEAKFSHHSLHLEYQYGDTSGGSQNPPNLRIESLKEKSNVENWVPVKMTRHRTKQENLVMYPTQVTTTDNTPKQGLKRYSNNRGGSSKKKMKTKRSKKTSKKETPYELRDRKCKPVKSKR